MHGERLNGEKLNSHDELEFTVTDDMLANLTLSPPQTSTQLTVVTEPPKPVTKAKGMGKKTKTTLCVPQCKHKGKETDCMVQCRLCQLWVHCEYVGERPETIIGVWSCHACRQLPSVVIQLVDKVSSLEETMLQLKGNNAELIKLVKAQCNANDTIRDKNFALVEEVACLRNEINHSNEIIAMNDKLEKLSSDLANLSQAPTVRESYAAIASRKTSKRVFMFDDHILRDIHKVTIAVNEPVALHTTSSATPKDLLIAGKWNEACKEADEVTIVCSEVVVGDADMTQMKQDFSDLISVHRRCTTTSSSCIDVSSVTISSVLPDATGTRDERIKESKTFLKDKGRDTVARFVDNDHNFLFRDGSCDTSAFQNDSVRLSTCGVKRLMSNLSLAASKHREDGAQLRRGAALCQDRLGTGRQNNAAAGRLVVRRQKGAAVC